ncbi:hypothetical protein CR513_04698, partial [Mucuna pruriens]
MKKQETYKKGGLNCVFTTCNLLDYKQHQFWPLNNRDEYWKNIGGSLIHIFDPRGTRTIMTDRDSKYLGHFQKLGNKLLYSTACHHQTDEKIEEESIPCMEFAYNQVFNTTTSYSPFKLAYGCTWKGKKNNMLEVPKKGRKEVLFKEGNFMWVHWRKELFPHLRRSNLLPRGDDMPKEFGGSNIFNVIDLNPCDAGVEKPNDA